MPRKTDRALALDELRAFRDLASVQLAADTTEDNFIWFIFSLAAVEMAEQTRYTIERSYVPKSTDWSTRVLPNLDELRSRSTIRMDWDSFKALVSILEHSPHFANNSACPQTPVAIQALVAVNRLGKYGNAASHIDVAASFAISEGSAFNFTRRVVNALYDLRQRYITWPDEEGRKRESRWNGRRQGFKGCVGMVDGCEVNLFEKPGQ